MKANGTFEYDTIVIGAGPAGSTAARLLARSGAKVLMLDRAGFPRDKPCGGGVTIQAARELDIDLAPVVERTITKAQISIRLSGAFYREWPEPLSYMTQRSRLDAYLAEMACEAGADFRDAAPVREIEAHDSHVIVRSNGDTMRARTVIGADGANGVTAKALGFINKPRRAAVAFEADATIQNGSASRWEDAIALDMGTIPGGYGWLFPKGDHVNIGVGGWKYAGPTLRDELSALCAFLELDVAKLTNLRGYNLPLRDAGAPIARGNSLLVGDAAGLVDPLSGEGIHAAFVSGRLASEAIQRYLSGDVDDLISYEKAVDRELMSEIEVSYKLQAVFHRFPRPSVAVLHHSDRFWGNFCGLVRGELTYTETEASLGPVRHFFNGLAKACAIGIRR
ncbi:MAG: geranylgeranyl reductase family protein [Chloroflexi bacterium]|nr:geranylgeranyl reductase family protein [Chloroflexota bacterium]MCI0889312.1 geranylgeranyl reductase family protein [Chloroflexota bacterium]